MKTNTIYCGDCLSVMKKYIPDNSIDLIYLDPPFFTNKYYEVIWKNGAEIRAFKDRWKGGIKNYILWMQPRLYECHRVLKQTGSMYLHCDWHANAHLRILMDRIFGLKQFQNEIIWFYKGAGASRKRYARKHDTILFYSRTSDFIFNYKDIMGPLTEVQKKRYTRKDEDGYFGIHHGRKYYLPKGKILEDVWQIPLIVPTSKERLGYPTQKPLKLLNLIIKASSNPMDIVLDPMCGCATTIASAHKLGRQWIGIDVSPTACKLMVKRMQKQGYRITTKEIIGLPRTIEELKNMEDFEFQNWAVQKVGGRVSRKKSSDMGIDGRITSPFGVIPIQVKQSEHIGRNCIDNFETAMRRTKAKKGIFIAFSFGKGAHEEIARAKLEDNLEIEAKTVEKLISENKE